MAKILSLEGKYYGTKVEFTTPENPNDTHEIVVWCPDHFAQPFASEREIQDGWTPEDGHDHVESVQDYKIAQIICEALTKNGY